MEEIFQGSFTFVEWIVQRGRKVITWILTLITFLVVGVLLYNKWSSNPEEDFLDSYEAYAEWEAASEGARQQLERLGLHVERHAPLHMIFDTLIAQGLMDRGEANHHAFAKPALERIKGLAPLYECFSQTGLRIADGEYALALKESIALQEVIPEKAPLLNSYNLLRIANLYHALGDAPAEKRTYIALKESKGYESLKQAFSEGSVNLEDFLNQ